MTVYFPFFMPSPLARRLMNRADDLVVAGAAAKVVCQPQPDSLLRWFRLLVEERFGSHDEARCTESALQRGLFEERPLHRVQIAAAGHPSMVVISLPAATTPRQEFTIRPSSTTVHAPQFPSLQPSLEPVKPRMSRKHSSRLCSGSQRNSRGSPLIVVRT